MLLKDLLFLIGLLKKDFDLNVMFWQMMIKKSFWARK